MTSSNGKEWICNPHDAGRPRRAAGRPGEDQPMRTLFLSLATAGLSLLGMALGASEAQAQFYNPYLAGYSPWVSTPPAFYNYRYYYSPYGLRTYSQYATA